MDMFDKLEGIEEKYEELSRLISDPEIISDQSKWQKLVKEHAELEEIVVVIREYNKVLEEKSNTKELLNQDDDEEIKILAEQELKELDEKELELEEKLKKLLIPKDPNDEKNVIMEIRAGAGGDEAALLQVICLEFYPDLPNGRAGKLNF